MAECTCQWEDGIRLTDPACPVHGKNATYPTVDPADDVGPPAKWSSEFENPEIGMKC